MLTWLIYILIVLTLISTYLFWVRPLLKSRPAFAYYYAQEESFWTALKCKVRGLKQKLTTVIVMNAGVVVSLHDGIVKVMDQAGYDVHNVQMLLPKVPPQMWPIIGMGLIALVQYFSNLRDKRAAEQAAADAIAAAQAPAQN